MLLHLDNLIEVRSAEKNYIKIRLVCVRKHFWT